MLVAVTVLIVGYGINALFPFIPLSLALTVVAVVTPTDAAAVEAFVPREEEYKIPVIILQNESLFNDATGFVAFQMAFAIYLTGDFSLAQAAQDLVIQFLGGLALGIVLGLIVRGIFSLLRELRDDTAFVMVIVELLVPFVVFFVGQQIGVSGILAVVAAGLVQGDVRDKLGLTSTRMQLVRSNVWEIVEGGLSGIVFVLLGVSLPAVVDQINTAQPNLVWLLVLVGVVLYLAKFALRLLWTRYLVWMHKESPHRWRDSWVMALSGVSGTISLSLALLLPLTVNGEPFTYRPMLIFIATVVIVISIVMPVFTFPLVVGKNSRRTEDEEAFAMWNRRMTVAGMKEVRDDPDHPTEASIVVESLAEQLVDSALRRKRSQRRVFRAILQAETVALERAHADGQIDDADWRDYQVFLEYLRTTFAASGWRHLWLRVRFGLHTSRHMEMTEGENMLYVAPLIAEQIYWRRAFELRGSDIRPLEARGFEAAMSALTKLESVQTRREVHEVRRFYQERHRRIGAQAPELTVLYQLFVRAFHAEFVFFQSALAANEIPVELASRLQERIIYDELAYLRNGESFSDRVTPD